MTKRAFTFVELLLVAITIAVLSASAIPNFLEARTRAQTAKNRSSLAVLQAAIESYRIDWKQYPPNATPLISSGGELSRLTTPIAFVTSVPSLDFTPADQPYIYLHLAPVFDIETNPWRPFLGGAPREWYLAVPGPKRIYETKANPGPPPTLTYTPYDPTNGTASRGDLEIFGP